MHRELLFVVGLGLACFGGCGGRGTLPCSGVVTLDGKPLADAAVAFLPKSGGPPATGRTDAEGRFTLTTPPDSPGALPGDYAVTVAAFTVKPPKQLKATDVYEQAPIEWRAPQRYSRPETSELTATIARGQQEFPFALKSK
jgi:hypothetical protein